MEEIKRPKGHQLVLITLGIMFGVVVLPSNIKSIAILLFGVAVLWMSLQRKFSFDKKFFFTNAGLYLVIALTFFYSDNSEYTIRKLTSMAALLVFPFVFSLLNKAEGKAIFKHLKTFLTMYVVGVFLYNVIPFIWFFATHYTWEGIIEHFITIIRVDMGKWNIHPIYMSMHCSIAILFSFYVLRETNSKKWIASLLAIDVVLVLFLLLYAKKGPLIALVVVFSLFVVFQRKQRLLKPYLFAVITLIALTVLIPKTRNKFVELFKIETLDKGTVTSTNIRYTIYASAKTLISESPLVGYGIGDYNDKLLESYEEKDDAILIAGKYNAHNQFLSLLLIGGIIALFAFVIMIGMNMVYAIRFNNQLLILLLIFYGIVMLTENILEREAGIVFFAFFINFFGLKSLYAREE